MNIPTIKLHDGYEIPAIGLGTVYLRGESGVDAITSAIRNGYRLIDSPIRYPARTAFLNVKIARAIL